MNEEMTIADSHQSALLLVEAMSCDHCRVNAFARLGVQLELAVLLTTEPPTVEFYQYGELGAKLTGAEAKQTLDAAAHYDRNPVQDVVLAALVKGMLMRSAGITVGKEGLAI
jgi:hypothetical protein